MRSHVVANPAEFRERDRFLNESKPPEAAAANGYVLRENPRKTWRAADARPPPLLAEEKVCKQCGKGFQSMKALCGHMACHSDKERGTKDDHSWTAAAAFDSQSEAESEEETKLFRATRSSKVRKCKKFAEDSPSSVSEIDGQEQEEMAKCLMMLSRDSCNNKVRVNSVVESSDNNSVVMETAKSSSIDTRKVVEEAATKMVEDSDSDSGYFLDECAKGESEVSVDWFRRNGGGFSERKRPQISLKLIKSRNGNGYDDGDDGGMGSRKRKYGSEDDHDSSTMVEKKKSKYECFNCKKTFKSYQALGGHRPCHKRSNAYGESGENTPDSAAAYYRSTPKFVESTSKKKESVKGGSGSSHFSEKKSKSKKNKAHVCPFCDRVFKNGQALGGHKRSHFLTGHDESSSRSLVEKPDLLDLNLPAPEADEEEGGGAHFFSW